MSRPHPVRHGGHGGGVGGGTVTSAVPGTARTSGTILAVARARAKRTKPNVAHNIWRPAFLEALAMTGNVTQSCEAAGVLRKTVYAARQNDPEFAAAWEHAYQQSIDALVREARRRAIEGYDRPIFQGGKEVGRVREYSDSLLLAMLKAGRPEEYGDRVRIDVVAETRRIARELGMTPDQEEAAVAEAENIMRQRRAEKARKV